MITNVITKLTGTVESKEFAEPRGVIAAVNVQPRPGCLVEVQLGSAGLVVSRRGTAAAIPLEAILELVFRKCPELMQPAKPALGDATTPIGE